MLRVILHEIRDYVILQQADHLDEAENFAQLKEFCFG